MKLINRAERKERQKRLKIFIVRETEKENHECDYIIILCPVHGMSYNNYNKRVGKYESN